MKQMWIIVFALLATTLAAAEPSRQPGTTEESAPTIDQPASQPAAATPETRPAPKQPSSLPLHRLDISRHPAPPAGSALARIIANQTLRVCVRSDVPPFGYFSSKGLTGFDIQLTRQLAMQISMYYKKNLHIQWRVIEAGERITKLQNKECDLVAASFSYTKMRASQVAFSKIYLETDQVAIAATSITRTSPLIALVRGTTNYAKGLTGTIRYFSNYKDIMHAMKNGEVDYVVTDRPIAMHMMRSVTKSFRLWKAFPQKERYGLGLHLKHIHLHKAVNHALVDLAKSGRLAYLYRQWL